MAIVHDVDGLTIKQDLAVEGNLSVTGTATFTGAISEQALSITVNSNAAAGTDEDPSVVLKGGDGGSEIIASTIKQDSSADLLYVQMGGGAAGTTRKSSTLVIGVPGETTASIDSTIRFEGASDAGVNRTASIVHLGEERRLTVTASNDLRLSDGTAYLDMTAGAFTENALASVDLTPSGAMTLRGGGVSQFGDDTGYIAFDGSGAVSTSGITTLALSGSTSVTVSMPDNVGTAFALKEGSTNYIIASTSNGTEKIQLVQNVELPQISEVVSGAGITLGSGTEIIGVPKVVSTAIAYNTADGNVFSVPASEVWLIEDMWFQTTVDWDGNGAFVVGDTNDADGFLTLANASLDPAYDESGGITGWPTGSRGLDSANRGVYLTTAVTFNKRMFRAVGPYNVVFDNTPGTSTAGSGTLYMRYTRIA